MQIRTGTLGTLVEVARGLPTPSLVLIGDVVAKASDRRELIALAASA
jgi:siroheme synthase